MSSLNQIKEELIKAASRGNYEEARNYCEELQTKKESLNRKDPFEDTAMMLAANNGHKEIVRMLMEFGADVDVKNGDGYTAMMLAAMSGHKEIVKMLLEFGADVDVKSKWGRSLVDVAYSDIREEVREMVRRHKEKSAKVRLGGFSVQEEKAATNTSSTPFGSTNSNTTAPVFGAPTSTASSPFGTSVGSSGAGSSLSTPTVASSIGSKTLSYSCSTSKSSLSSNPLTEKLLELAEAKEKSLISESEFDDLRKKLLENFATHGW